MTFISTVSALRQDKTALQTLSYFKHQTIIYKVSQLQYHLWQKNMFKAKQHLKFPSLSHKSSERLQQSTNVFFSHNTVCYGCFRFPIQYMLTAQNLHCMLKTPQVKSFKLGCGWKIFLHLQSLVQNRAVHAVCSAREDQSQKTKTAFFYNKIISYYLIPMGRWENRKVSIRRENLKKKRFKLVAF